VTLITRLRRLFRPKYVGVVRLLPHVLTCPRRPVDLWFNPRTKRPVFVEDQPTTITRLPHIPEVTQ
jgi:hypothetical protein